MSLLSRLLGKPDVGSIPYPQNSPEGLAARWVQWGASTNIAKSPIADETGIHANAEQPEDVWFLAGCFGGTVKRRCTVPANTKIFFPVFNIWMSKGYQSPDLSNVFGYLEVDGKEVELDNIQTKRTFIVKGVWGNPVTNSIFGTSMFVSGLWKLIDPLEVGEHKIYFRGGDGYDFSLDVTYNLTVRP